MVEKAKTGTTTLAIRCKDGVVLAADMRSTMGNVIARRVSEKISKITDTIAMTHAGIVSDIQLMEKLIKAEIKLKEIRNKRPVLVSEAANYVSGILYEMIRNPYAPSLAHFIMAGYDSSGAHIFDLMPDGVITEIEDYEVSGSGGDFAVGIIDARYKKDMTVKEAKDLAVEALQNAMKRDSASGDGVMIVVVDKNGVHEAEKMKVVPTLK